MTWEGESCIPPGSDADFELKDLESRLAYLERGIGVVFGVDAQVRADMLAEVEIIRGMINELKARRSKPRDTEML